MFLLLLNRAQASRDTKNVDIIGSHVMLMVAIREILS